MALEIIANPNFGFNATTIALSAAHSNAPARSTHSVVLYEHPYNNEPLITRMVAQQDKQLIAGLALNQVNRGYLYATSRIAPELAPELLFQAASGPIVIYHYALSQKHMQEQFAALRSAIKQDLILALVGSPLYR